MASSSSSSQEIIEYKHRSEKSTAYPKLYDAFISHRGPDVKNTLAKQLYKLLQDRGRRAFLDREEIEGGDSIPSAIHNAICSSVVQIAIFSKGYTSSSWCLDELALMLQQCPESLFIPVFYDVQPWELRYIDNEKGSYAPAFAEYASKGRNRQKLEGWKDALVSASNVSGYEQSQYGDDLCEKIVSRVLQELEKKTPLHVAEYPIGLAELVQDFESCCSETLKNKVKIIGIIGLGGSGKTTLAKELVNRKRSAYDASCFLFDVRESHAQGELHFLQSQLFKDLFHEDRKFRNVHEGIGQLEHRLERAKRLGFDFLIVLDDIDHQDQLHALLFEAMLSPGSLVIVTTRDQSVLMGADITINYKMKGMDRHQAKALFCSHAFRGRHPPIGYSNLVESFVKFCGGLPLSLKVLGGHVCGRNENYWELELEKIGNIQPKDIMQRLKISFDGLDSQEKQIFMDIACFFIKEKKNVAISVWKGCRWSAEQAVQTLQDRCLVEVVGKQNMYRMHDHLRDLGRQMADDLGPLRLWRPEDLRSMEAKGFKRILAETKGRCLHSFQDASLNIKITYFVGNLDCSAETSTVLLWLEIDDRGGKLKSIPSWIPLQKLQCLTIWGLESWSALQQKLQTDAQASFELRVLQIRHCPLLQNLPDFIGMFNHLEELVIFISLEDTNTEAASFSKSVTKLSKLRRLNMWKVALGGELNLRNDRTRDSTHSESFTGSCMNSLQTMYLGNLNLSKLFISGDMCPRLRSLELSHMSNLIEVDLQLLRRLTTLIVWGCHKLETISGLSSITGLEVVCTRGCKGLKSLPSLERLRCLKRIEIGECDKLPCISGLEVLEELKSLVIQEGGNGDAVIWNCIYGLKRLPSEYTILTGKLIDQAASKLNVNLFSDLIDAHAVTEIQRGRTETSLELGNSSSEITICALLLTSCAAYLKGLENLNTDVHYFPQEGKWMVTVLHTTRQKSDVRDSGVKICDAKIHKGFMATMNKCEDGKALTVFKRIIDQLYG